MGGTLLRGTSFRRPIDKDGFRRAGLIAGKMMCNICTFFDPLRLPVAIASSNRLFAHQNIAAGVAATVAQLLFDPHELVVFGKAIGT